LTTRDEGEGAVAEDQAGLFAGSDAAAPGVDDDPAEAVPRRSATWPEVDRRTNADRRGQPTGWLSHPFGFRRRKAGRRAGERDNIYVDVYSRSDVMILLGIFLLNIGDALFTLLWLQRGGGEGNPIMQAMLDIGVGAFLFQKCIVVGVWLLILTAHRNYRTARLGLWSTLSVYTLLIVYHLLLVGLDVQPVPPPHEVAPSPSVAPDPGRSEIAPEYERYGGLYPYRPGAEGDPR
jgi:hypothetical protein